MARGGPVIAGGKTMVDAAIGFGLRSALHRPAGAKRLFRLYGKLPERLRGYLYWHFATHYCNRRAPDYATWIPIEYAGRHLELPLRAESFAIDFNVAMSLPIHDLAVKQTYTRLQAEARPTVFIDIGANYGTHSFIWALSGARVYSIEPNPHCHGYLRRVAERNGLSIELLPVALAERPATLSLVFPPGETRLGAVSAAAPETVDTALLRVDGIRAVPFDRLDIAVADGARVVLKIDVEGHEAAVLAGAARFIREHRPLIVFEARPNDDRRRLAASFSGLGYRLMTIGERPGRPPAAITAAEFEASLDENFLALPETLS